MKTLPHILLSGVPCVGKTLLGAWLQDEGIFYHIDAEKNDGKRLDVFDVHDKWDGIFRTEDARAFTDALRGLDRPVAIDWGFPPEWLSVVAALARSGVQPWWISGERVAARSAFVKRGGSPVAVFDQQFRKIQSHWNRIHAVFSPRCIEGLDAGGNQRCPSEMWDEMTNHLLRSEESKGANKSLE